MNNSEYEKIPGIRRSDLWYMNKTPLHFRWHMDHGEEPTPALIFGQAAHKYVLEPESFTDEFSVMPLVDRRTKAGKEAYTAFLNEAQGKTVISSDDFDQIREMAEVLNRNPRWKQIRESALAIEMGFVWTDDETGEVCKCKADMITEVNGMPVIVDYKTTNSCEDGVFERSCRKYGYDFQCGFYTEGVELSSLEAHSFLFVAQEKTAPYAVRFYWCDDGFVRAGKAKFHELLRRYHDCVQSGEWSGYEESELLNESYDE